MIAFVDWLQQRFVRGVFGRHAKREQHCTRVVPRDLARPWEAREPGTWATRAWLRGYITAGGRVPPQEFERLWGQDDTCK